MNKDVIYIDVEDDITAVISKVKASKEKIVALVPPKRVGILQSAVNLRLLNRAAKTADKRIVLISNNPALMSLAAAATIPVAKNLQSKPEVAEASTPEADDDEDVIDGQDLPVGEHAKMASTPDQNNLVPDSAIDDIEEIEPPKPNQPREPRKPRKAAVKVPNFSSFRKKLVLGIIGGILLIIFLVWAFVFAPHATIVIAARTTSSSINTDVTIADNVSTSVDKATLKASVATQSDDISQEFTATGTKNAGNKANGSIELSNESLSSQTIAAGTKLTTSSGLVFVVDTDVTVPAATFPCGNISCATPGQTNSNVTADKSGATYNAASGNLNGAPNNVNATFNDPTSGGTDKIVKVVTQADVVKAKQTLVDKNTDDVKNELKKEFKGDVIALEDTFQADYSKVVSAPAVNAEATNGKATLTGEVVYKMYGVDKSEVDEYLNKTLEAKLDSSESQHVYETGASKAQFQDVTKTKNGAQATLVATGHIGPKIDEGTIKSEARSKKFGDIQADIPSISGVKSVDVKFLQFWVSTVPNDVKKISVEFKLDESN